MIHIKRDGAWLCKNQDSTWHKKRSNVMKFSHVHKLKDPKSEKNMCKKCLKRYYEILANQKQPLIIS